MLQQMADIWFIIFMIEHKAMLMHQTEAAQSSYHIIHFEGTFVYLRQLKTRNICREMFVHLQSFIFLEIECLSIKLVNIYMTGYLNTRHSYLFYNKPGTCYFITRNYFLGLDIALGDSGIATNSNNNVAALFFMTLLLL